MVGNYAGDHCSAPAMTGIGFRDWLRGRLTIKVIQCVADEEAQRIFIRNLYILDQLPSSIPKFGSWYLNHRSRHCGIPTSDEVIKHATLMAVFKVLRDRGEDIIDGAYGKFEGQQDLFANFSKGTWVDRRLYHTSNGYVRLGPALTGLNDEVLVLPRAAVPFMLSLSDLKMR